MKLIYRDQYMDKLKSLRKTPDIKIITGIRRSGKSELLKAYAKFLKVNGTKTNIIAIDYNSLDFLKLKDYLSLFNYVESKYKEGYENVLLIDEIQFCKNFELAINSFHNSKKYDIYITGSNAFLLSSDLATLFTGRFIEIPVFPFSFSEYCAYFEIKNNYNEHLREYLIKGGMAGSYLYDSKNSSAYIQNIYKTLIKRDLVDKYSISEEALLDSLTEFMMDNIGNITTASNISNAFKYNKVLTNHVTIGNYIKYLCNAFLFYKVKRYDIKGKKYLATNEKYYLADLAFRYSMLGTANIDYGRAYENIVAIELLRRGYDIYVGKLYEKEVDFIANINGEKTYIQVADNISDKNVLNRELKPLAAIKNSYPKILLANTGNPPYDIEGIKIIDIADWLINYK